MSKGLKVAREYIKIITRIKIYFLIKDQQLSPID